MRNKLFLVIALIIAFIVVFTACGTSHDEVEKESDAAVEDVTEDVRDENMETDVEQTENEHATEQVDEQTDEGNTPGESTVSEKVKQDLIDAGVYGLDQGQEYSVQFKGEEFDFEHLGCRLTDASNFIAAEGPNNLNVYIEFNFDEEGTVKYHQGSVSVMNIGEDGGYFAKRDELKANNFIAIEENAKIIYGEVPVYLNGETDND